MRVTPVTGPLCRAAYNEAMRSVWRHAGLAVAAVSLAGCGVGAPATTTSGGTAPPPQFLAYADCMRSHGVPNYSDGGGNAGPGSVSGQSPAFAAAQHSCQKLLPAPIGPHAPSEHQRRLAVAFSACVRAHGLPQFPDPRLTVPPPGQGSGIVRAGMYWPLPAGTAASPAFERAAVACGWSAGRAQASPA